MDQHPRYNLIKLIRNAFSKKITIKGPITFLSVRKWVKIITQSPTNIMYRKSCACRTCNFIQALIDLRQHWNDKMHNFLPICHKASYLECLWLKIFRITAWEDKNAKPTWKKSSQVCVQLDTFHNTKFFVHLCNVQAPTLIPGVMFNRIVSGFCASQFLPLWTSGFEYCKSCNIRKFLYDCTIIEIWRLEG